MRRFGRTIIWLEDLSLLQKGMVRGERIYAHIFVAGSQYNYGGRYDLEKASCGEEASLSLLECSFSPSHSPRDLVGAPSIQPPASLQREDDYSEMG